jgi:uncharacterized membrane-anchored protein
LTEIEDPAGQSDVAFQATPKPVDHPDRRRLNEEVHARPYAHLEAPVRATHLALLTGEAGLETDLAHLRELCQRYGVAAPDGHRNHELLDFGAFRLKWERHTEFTSYTFFIGGRLPRDPFKESAIEAVPRDWVEGIPGELLSAVKVVLEPRTAPKRSPESVTQMLSTVNFAASYVAGGSAMAFMDFSMDAKGYGRVFLRDVSLRPRQAGRLVQRLLEIETYRMMALLAFPLAKARGAELTRMGNRLTDVTQRMTEIRALEDERQLLVDITTLSADVERVAAETSYRFSAASAYYELVERRIEELREERLEGFQTFKEFMERRLTPAMRTCDAVRDRLETLSRRVTRAGQLLRTRVDIQVEGQNRDLLASMDRRAKLQLRLQETVEGLSLAAITYYAVGLVNYALEAAVSAGATGLPVDLLTGLAVPVVALGGFLAVRKIRKQVMQTEGGE